MNIKYIRIATVILLSMVSLSLNNRLWGQYYGIGEEPAGVKWSKASSKNFEIIMPKSFRNYKCDTYLKYLNLIEQHYGIFADSIKYNYSFSRRYPTVVHPFNAHSNGLTVWAPRRIDYFSMYYTAISYPQNWMEQLVLHEGRHAWQIAHFHQGFWNFATVLFGEQAVGLASGVYPSRWMLEGDAVVAETERGDFGRGRNGDFLSNTLLCIEPADGSYKNVYNKNRSWDRWRFGYVKYYSPNAYDIGYVMAYSDGENIRVKTTLFKNSIKAAKTTGVSKGTYTCWSGTIRGSGANEIEGTII